MDDLASALRNAHRCTALGIEAALHLDAEIAIFATVVVVLILFLNTLDGDAVVGWRTVVLDTLPHLTALLAIQVVVATLGNMNLLVQVVATNNFRGDDDLVIDSIDNGVAARTTGSGTRTTGSTGRASWTARPSTRTTRFARWIKWSASWTATSTKTTAGRKV